MRHLVDLAKSGRGCPRPRAPLPPPALLLLLLPAPPAPPPGSSSFGMRSVGCLPRGVGCLFALCVCVYGGGGLVIRPRSESANGALRGADSTSGWGRAGWSRHCDRNGAPAPFGSVELLRQAVLALRGVCGWFLLARVHVLSLSLALALPLSPSLSLPLTRSLTESLHSHILSHSLSFSLFSLFLFSISGTHTHTHKTQQIALFRQGRPSCRLLRPPRTSLYTRRPCCLRSLAAMQVRSVCPAGPISLR